MHPLEEAYAPVYEFQKTVFIAATLMMLLLTAISMGFGYIFVRPINALIGSARKVQVGNLDAFLEWESRDEFGELAKAFNSMVDSVQTQTQLLEKQKKDKEILLLRLFPTAIAKRLNREEKAIVDCLSDVSIACIHIKGFNELETEISSEEALNLFHILVSDFDEVAEIYRLEKIKTIGTSYIAACGISTPYIDRDKRAIDFSLELLTNLRRFNYEKNLKLSLQIGIDTGDVVSGIVGRNKLSYDVWGETINRARTLQLACPPDMILISQTIFDRLHDLYPFELIGSLATNGTDCLNAWGLKIQPTIKSEKS
jgi:class 3 adenylate cyclase